MREYRKSYSPLHRKNNPEMYKIYDKKRYYDLKEKAFHLLGNKCSFCLETETEFLTMDHINNDGHSDKRSRRQLYKFIINNPDQLSLRLLCRNCNSGSFNKLVHNKDSVSKHEFTDVICDKCGSFKIRRHSKHPKYGTRKRIDCLTCNKNNHLSLKLNAFSTLGSVCACCGENEHNKLTIDHVNEDGFVDRSTMSYSTKAFYGKIVNKKLDLSRYQILCWNCNFSKHLGKGICTHFRKEEQ